ncbi:indole-3-glycerol-phosphate synthase [Candidatus Bathyarchaeota archaeon]|nr:MAG: indole-3-glycerol-phosphate synthase [Candidatus Bathyarchaeota archaeon]
MVDYIAGLALKAGARVGRGYYDNVRRGGHPSKGLTETIQKVQGMPVITEVKFASPSAGKIREHGDPLRIARAMLKGGACAISVLTDPEDFQGNLDILALLSREVDVPVVMKDIIVSPVQIQAAAKAGAKAVVLISELFSRRLTEEPLDKLVREAGRLGVEVLLEANSPEEFRKLPEYKPDLYGINNRNLSTFQLDMSTTERVLATNGDVDRTVVSESGIENPRDIVRLRNAGAEAFLVGTSIMKSSDVESKVRELVNA